MSTANPKNTKPAEKLLFPAEELYGESLGTDAIHRGDCVELLRQLDDESVDLVFADPPFNIGYEYDQYEDKHSDEDYLKWCEAWISQTHRVLKPSGSFWLAIGDEYAAELKVLAKQLGYTPRNWVVWYYTFGQNCSRKFNRSHAHLFHFVKDESLHTFNADDPAVRVPSARALVYGDKRANPKGRLPDDTWMVAPERSNDWVLRPQDLQEAEGAFAPLDDTWYFSRVAGTFKERQGFHGCQMPEQLLGRIVRVCSKPGDLVVDPFSGSGTTLAVAKKLGRRWLGLELSDDYVKYSNERLEKCEEGDELIGPADPVGSAPSTAAGRKLKGHPLVNEKTSDSTDAKIKALKSSEPKQIAASNKSEITEPLSPNTSVSIKDLTRQAIVDAFVVAHDGKSVDWLLCDPQLQQAYHSGCQTAGLIGGPTDWNHELLKLRKSGHLPKLKLNRSTVSSEIIDRCAYAAEIAWRESQRKYPGVALDELFASPGKAFFFDRAAAKQIGRDALAEKDEQGNKTLSESTLRWAALRLRKARHSLAKEAKQYDYVLQTRDFNRFRSWARFRTKTLSGIAGVYLLRAADKSVLYVGETLDLAARLTLHNNTSVLGRQISQISIIEAEELPSIEYRQPLWTHLVERYEPRWNIAPAKVAAE